MKLVKSLFVVTTFLFSITAVNAEVLKGCAAKKQQIENQLQYAHSRGNVHEISGLQKALDENMSKCDDLNLKQKREQKVLEKQRKVEKIELEIQQANETQNINKIRKKQAKLKDAQQDLNEAKTELDS